MSDVPVMPRGRAMRPALAEALEYCRRRGLGPAVLVLPFAPSPGELDELRGGGHVAEVLPAPAPAATPRGGDPGAWGPLTGRRGPVVLVGSHLLLTRPMVGALLRSGRLAVHCRIGAGYGRLPLPRFALWSAADRFVRWFERLAPDNPVKRGLLGLARNRRLFAIWTRLFKREGLQGGPAGGSAPDPEIPFVALVERAPAPVSSGFVRGRVVLINHGLAAGGAERQIVNTLIGLQASGACESVTLLGEHIAEAAGLDFFLAALAGRGIEVSPVRRRAAIAARGLADLPPDLGELVAGLPPILIAEVVDLVQEFRDRRPEVVHAWQDSTSVKAGLAAVLAGVPRIVLGGRNLAPTHFCYFAPYMRPAYRALARLDRVALLNNSRAGAEDYARWLALPPDRLTVLRNGVQLDHLARAAADEVLAYRAALGIPSSARVVGSVFRFWEEKRPLLWLRIAEHVVRGAADVHFVVIGDGPLRGEMASFARSGPLAGRVHLPGPRPDIALPLSAMDLFLLASAFEGTPNVLLEAQWLGLPVVTTDAGGAREAVAPEGGGAVLDSQDPGEIGDAVLALLARPELARHAEVAGPRHVCDHFGFGRMIGETLAIYRLADPRAAGRV